MVMPCSRSAREAVGELRQVGLAAFGDVGQLVLQHRAAVDEQAADQRALAVIDAAAGDEFEGRAGVELACSGALDGVSRC